MGAGADGRSYAISGQWDPCDPSFQILNTETPKGNVIVPFRLTDYVNFAIFKNRIQPIVSLLRQE